MKRGIDDEYVDPTDLDMRGVLAAVGIVKGNPFSPAETDRAILERLLGVPWQWPDTR